MLRIGLVAGVLAVLVALVFVGCGPTVRDLAWERNTIRKQVPGARLKNKTGGVYEVEMPDGSTHEAIVEERKVVGDSCVSHCFSEESLDDKRKKR